MPPRSNKRKAPASDAATAASSAAAAASASLSSSVTWPAIAEAKSLVAELCASFYGLGWVSGTGGGLSMRAGPDGESVVMAPSGVQKERMTAEDMFVLRKSDGEVVEEPKSNSARRGQRPLKLSECAPLFMSAYELRDAGAVVHSHSLSAVAATLIQGEDSPSFKATHLEMCKGIDGHGFHSTVEVPIVENTARECELTGRLREAISAFPRSNAVLVRRHGVYVWGSTWQRAKAQAETYDYLFEAALRLKQAAGVDVSRPPPPPQTSPPPPPPAPAAAAAAVRAIVLDIEGTVLPISFVKDVLSPYSRRRFGGYLGAEPSPAEGAAPSAGGSERSEVVEAQLAALSEERRAGSSPASFPLSGADAVRYLELLADADVKSTALKAIQGSIWHEGFSKGELQAPLFADVPGALARWTRRGIKVFIYSSGSKMAQVDLFAHTNVGDLSCHISGYFDTTSGAKVDPSSYQKIFSELGVDESPSGVLFVTDILAEGTAAKEAGWSVVMASRPGNAQLPVGHGFKVVNDFVEEIF